MKSCSNRSPRKAGSGIGSLEAAANVPADEVIRFAATSWVARRRWRMDQVVFPIQDSVPSCSVPVVTRALIPKRRLIFLRTGVSQHALDQVFYLFGMDALLSDHFDRARELGLPVRNDVQNVMHLLQPIPAAYPPTALRRVFAGS